MRYGEKFELGARWLSVIIKDKNWMEVCCVTEWLGYVFDELRCSDRRGEVCCR